MTPLTTTDDTPAPGIDGARRKRNGHDNAGGSGSRKDVRMPVLTRTEAAGHDPTASVPTLMAVYSLWVGFLGNLATNPGRGR